eukprot:TRINITY_DN4267_c0_g1_i9.p1 TRINITY_DN4267_c0_g1~~TRINITY_DN4267_c0_g1_i9.p1  ORF type:complete len:884 (-),score=164.05 TRINITY_DN4267_c0_g1_i9:265-2916(-)
MEFTFASDDYKWTDGHPYMYPSNAFYRDIHSGIQGPYGRGAYDLIMDPNDENIISRLQEHNWIDRPTRAVAINFAFFNADLGFVTAVEYLFEISPTGRIEPTRRVTSYPIMRKGDTTKMSIFVVFCVITMFWFYYEGKQMIHDFRQYISSSWNKIEIVNIALFTGLVIMLGVYVDESANAIEMLELTGRETGLKFYDFQTASYLYFTLQQLVGTCVLFYFVKVFKFFRAFRKLNLLWRTLELASGTLKAYSVTFIIMFIAFSLQGYYLFGFQLRTFHTFPISILTAFRLLSGDFDFSNMQTTSPILGPVFFMAYMIFVFLILINLFIAILSQYYEAASREAAEAEKLGFGGNTEYELTTRLYNARPRIVLSKKYRFLALEQNTYVAVVLSHHDIQFDVKESDRFRVLYMRSDAFSNENLMLLLGEKSIECCVQDCEEEYNFALDKIEVDASTAKDNGDDLEEVRRHLHRLREYKDVSVNLYRMDGYCRMTKDAVISIPYGILLQMFHMKMGRVFHSVFTSKPKEFSILSDQQVEKMLERLCSGKLANKGDYGLILDMSSAAFKKELEDLEKELSADGRFDKLSLADILDQLKSKQSQAKVMMRFDELVREIRLAVALLRKSGGKGTYATADIMRDALRIFETMPKSCFYTINKEEAAKQYEPRVYNTSGVDIEFMIPLIETIAEHVHDNWTLTKLEQGWRYGPKRNNDDKVHPAMIPYEELTENEKSYDKNMAKEAVKLIITLGYKIDKGAKIETNFVSIKEEYKERLPPNYVLKIVDTSAAPLDQTILELSDIIAENVHNEWAKKRLEEGLIYAPEGSKVPNSSPFLLPYFMMTKKEREADQRTALETLRIIAVHGYRIHKPESSTFWTRMPSWFKYRSTGA